MEDLAKACHRRAPWRKKQAGPSARPTREIRPQFKSAPNTSKNQIRQSESKQNQNCQWLWDRFKRKLVFLRGKKQQEKQSRGPHVFPFPTRCKKPYDKLQKGAAQQRLLFPTQVLWTWGIFQTVFSRINVLSTRNVTPPHTTPAHKSCSYILFDGTRKCETPIPLSVSYQKQNMSLQINQSSDLSAQV